MAFLRPFIQPQFRDDVRAFGRTAVDALWPPHSLLDGQVLPYTGGSRHMVSLWQKIEFLDAPCCNRCGYPFEFDVGDDVLCGACVAAPPSFTKGRAAIRYTQGSKKLVLDFKHGGHTDGLNFFARQMHRVGRDILAEADMLLPIPLHSKRLRARRFNQSALLARKLSQLSRKPYHTRIIIRTRNTPSQGSQTYLGRKRNVSGAFTVPPTKRSLINNRRVVLIDDVFTTGATLHACAATLLRAGAARADFLTLMRVVRPASGAT